MFSLNSLRAAVQSVLLLGALLPTSGHASIVVNGTRVIYPGNEKEVTVKLSNVGKSPVLVQNWIDKGDVDTRPENIQVPFILLPPVNRIDPSRSQTLRLSYTASPALPEDRESVYWLNVLEIPPVTKDVAPNRLQVAFRTRVKIFYRPAPINDPVKAEAAMKKLTWSVSGDVLKATNTSPYFISLVSVTAKVGSRKSIADGEMVPPMGSQTFHLKDASILHAGTAVSWEFINDWGAVGTASVTL